MSVYKAIAIDFGRKQLQAAGHEQDFLNRLSEEDKSAYATTFVISWIDINLAARLLEAMGPVLFPQASAPLFEMGKRLAIDNLNGIYKFILGFFSVEKAMEKSAKLWGTYHKVGAARCERLGDQRVLFVVEDYPNLPEAIRQMNGGYIAGIMSLVGARNIGVKHDASSPRSWRWNITWTQ